MNYSQLKTNIEAWAQRGSASTAYIPTCIELAEERFNRTLRLNALSDTTTLTILSGQSSVALPADYAEGRAVTASDGDWTQCTPEQLGRLIAVGSSDKSFAIFGGELHVPFAVGSDTPLTMAYWQTLPALSDTNTSNWLLAHHPGLYMWTALAELMVLQVDMERAQMFEGRAQAAMAELKAADQAAGYFAATLTPSYVV